MGRYIRGNVDESVTLTTLGPRTIASAAFDDVVKERTLVTTLIASYTLTKFTKATDDGPIMVGVAHSDYSEAEIQAVIDNTGSWDEGDLTNQELGKRKVRIIGTFGVPDDATQVSRLADGRAIRTKLNWILNAGQTLQLWGYNLGASALATTVPVIHCQGHANLWPR